MAARNRPPEVLINERKKRKEKWIPANGWPEEMGKKWRREDEEEVGVDEDEEEDERR